MVVRLSLLRLFLEMIKLAESVGRPSVAERSWSKQLCGGHPVRQIGFSRMLFLNRRSHCLPDFTVTSALNRHSMGFLHEMTDWDGKFEGAAGRLLINGWFQCIATT